MSEVEPVVIREATLSPERVAELERLLAGSIDAEAAESAWRMLDVARDIVLLAHENPDPDALGSALGLAQCLEPLGKRCVVACADPVPASFTFLPGRESVVTELPDERFDLVVALDAGDLTRYGALYTRHQAFFDAAPIVNIDHHITSPGIGTAIIDPISAATAELLTLFLAYCQVPLSRDAAQNLLAGIITDTRAFEYDATTDRTLAAGAYLVSQGGVPLSIIKPMYRLKPLAQVRLMGLVLNTIESEADGRVLWARLPLEFLERAHATPDMDDGLPSFLMDIEGADIVALFREQAPGRTRVSLRAAAPFDAAEIAALFGGGGHLRAAGCTVDMDLDDAIRVVVPHMVAALERQA